MTGVKIKKIVPLVRKLPPATEFQEQRELVKWVKMQPRIKHYLVKLNNEGKRSSAQGYQLKLMGMCTGASDLFLAYPAHGFHGLWIELKRARKYSPSERESTTWQNQMLFQRNMRAMGYACVFAYGWEMGREKITEYLDGKTQNWHID